MIKIRLIQLVSHAKRTIAWVVLWQWLSLLAQILFVFTLAHLLEQVLFQTGIQEMMGKSFLILIGCIAVRCFCERCVVIASYRASADVKHILRDQIYRKLLRIGASYREQVSSAEVVQMTTDGVEQLETYFGRYLPQFFYSLLAPVTLFLLLKGVSFRVSLILLLCVPLIPLSIAAVQTVAKRLLSDYWQSYTGLGDTFLENLQGLTTLKIYEADRERARMMDEEAEQFRRITMKVLTMQLNSITVMDLIAYGGAAAGMVIAVIQFLHGEISLSGALTLILLASEFFIPLRLLGSFFHVAMGGMAASDKIFRLLDLQEPTPGTLRLPKGPLSITLQGVHFCYEPEREILKGISMSCSAGQFLSLVGESGCGKSTIAGLIAGRNRGFAGVVQINGQDLARIQEADLMQNVVLVRHNSYLFKGTVAENLRMARPDASEEALCAVLQKVNLLGFLEQEQGLETRLLEKGTNFSGGQRQRLAIARALLKDASIYIFDEATSNIDVESEAVIMEVIHALAKTKTVLLISHRLANVTRSDCIYFIEDGRVRESGTHEALLKKNGAYARLYLRQQSLEKYGKEQEHV
uniref:ABC transporter ATP-binding protein/permease n=1 Tax=Ndongobacter massiliensis TaxID=1871025 RepID=UPI0009305039|nr:ABC transporter ATP-binding protein/permease [Ndongobacter massiliensis]